MRSEDLIAFEKEIEQIYATGVIRGPIHLRNGCEQQLIKIFEAIDPSDYVYSTWASHLHALLHGVPRDLVKQQILDGKSITLSFPEHNFYTSAIVGGVCPIAVGTAFGLKRRRSLKKVWCFIGDMTFMTGIVSESIRYATNWNLPIMFVVEDNKKSVGTPTNEVWNQSVEEAVLALNNKNVQYYKYDLTYPHSGIGRFLAFN